VSDVLTYAARAVPWWRLGMAVALVVIIMELVRWHPWSLWPLEGAAVGLLAGAAAWCVDEQSATVVDAAPRGLGWRTGVRLTGVAVLAVTWAALVAHAHQAVFGHAVTVLLHGWVAILAGLAWGTWRRSRGEAMPGLAAASVAVPLATAWALIRPWEHRVPLFPYGQYGVESDWRTSTVIWSGLGVVALGVLGAALWGRARWSVRREPVRRSPVHDSPSHPYHPSLDPP